MAEAFRKLTGVLLTLTLLGGLLFANHATNTGVLAARENSDWVVQSTIPIGSNLTSIAFADQNNGVAVGSNGAMFITHDGGATWSTYVTGENDDFTRVRFFDSTRGAAIAADGFYVTTDAGTTWRSIPQNNYTEDVASPAAGTYYSLGSYSDLSVTTDGGSTWQDLSNPFDGYVNSIQFTNLTEGWAWNADWSETYPTLWRTMDRGATWNQVNLQAEIVTIWPFGSSIVALLKDSNGLYLSESNDDGTTWNRVEIPRIGGNALSFRFVSPTEGIFSHSSGNIYLTHDGGVTWQTETLPTIGISNLTAAFVGYRGSIPYAVTADGQFLILGSLAPSPTPTATSAPSATNAPSATATNTASATASATATLPPSATATSTPTPTAEGQQDAQFPTSTPVPSATATASPTASSTPTATSTPVAGGALAHCTSAANGTAVQLQSLSPLTVTAGTAATITVSGCHFASDALISVGTVRVPISRYRGTMSISFVLPSTLGVGTYDVTVALPDGHFSTLVGALTIRSVEKSLEGSTTHTVNNASAPLTVNLSGLHKSIPQGGSAVFSLQTDAKAKIVLGLTTNKAKATSRISVRIKAGAHGQRSVAIFVASDAASGSYLLHIKVTAAGRTVSTSFPFNVSKRACETTRILIQGTCA